MPHRKAWREQPADGLQAFVDAVYQLSDRHPDGNAAGDVAELLEAAAARLNADEPPAPKLGTLIHGGRAGLDGLSYLGETITTGWIDPAKIAWAGDFPWNAFTYRQDTTTMLAEALLSGDPHQALRMWNFDDEPILLLRVPGPAGPLYQRDANGTHRIHAARMIGLPLIWAEIRQYTLPFQVKIPDLVTPSNPLGLHGIDQAINCWRGLLNRGLVIGQLTNTNHPPAAAITPDWAAAPWLLASPPNATRWAANYDRAYPGALDALGIPTTAWSSPDTWHDWLTST